MSDVYIEKIVVDEIEHKIRDVDLTASVTELQTSITTELAKRPVQLCFTNKTVETTDWVDQSSDPDIADYPYRAAITTTGTTSDFSPDVRFDLDEAVSGIFAPIAVSDSNVVYIYASTVPASDITIPAIICTKVGV